MYHIHNIWEYISETTGGSSFSIIMAKPLSLILILNRIIQWKTATRIQNCGNHFSTTSFCMNNK